MRRVSLIVVSFSVAVVGLMFLLRVTAVSAEKDSPELVLINPLLTRPEADSQDPELIPFDGVPEETAPGLIRVESLPAQQPAVLDGQIAMSITLNTEFICDPAGPTVITVPVGSQLFYCYIWTNATTSTFEVHDLVDSEYGPLLNQYFLPLPPGESVAFFLPTLASTDTVNSAVWTAFDLVTPMTQTAVASATVIVSGTLPPIADFGLPYIVSSQPTDTLRNQYFLARNHGVELLTWEQADCNTAAWLTLPMTNGVVSSFSSSTITTTFDSTGIASGSYSTTLCFNTNDPVQPVITKTAYLNVFAGGFAFDATVGTDPHVCAITDVITATPGTEISYCYTIYNGLNEVLEMHQLESQQYGTIPFFPYTLLPGQTAHFQINDTALVTVTDQVTWTSMNPDGTLVVSGTATTTVNVQGSAIPRLELTPESLAVSLPQETQLTRYLDLQNRGAADLDWSLADCSGGLPGWLDVAPIAGQLAPGEGESVDVAFDSAGLTAGTYATDLCLISNDPDQPSVTVPISLNVTDGQADGLVFTKTVGLEDDECAATDVLNVMTTTAVTYCYWIENRTNDLFLFHDVVDSELGVLLEEFPYIVYPGEQAAFLLTNVVITQTTTSTTTWTATDPWGTVYVAADTTTVNMTPPEAASIDLKLTVGLEPGCAESARLTVPIPPEGLAVTYCYQVTNQSPYALNWHNVEDTLHGNLLESTWHELPAGTTYAFTRTTVITGPTTNHATWHAYNDEGPEAWAENTAVVLPVETEQQLFLPILSGP